MGEEHGRQALRAAKGLWDTARCIAGLQAFCVRWLAEAAGCINPGIDAGIDSGNDACLDVLLFRGAGRGAAGGPAAAAVRN